MKNRIKQLFSIVSRFYLKNFWELFKKESIKLDKTKKNIILIDSASYGNLGDQAISFSIENIIKDNNLNFIDIAENDFFKNLKYLKKNISLNDVICMNGGGNMGDLYPRYEAIRRIAIKSFPYNKIVIFPQTIDYSNTKYGNREQKKSVHIYNKHNNLVICAREEKSFEVCKKLYSNSKVLLIPDIVLYLALKYNNINNERNKNIIVGVCLRDDKERAISNHLIEVINNMNEEKRFLTTMSNNDFINKIDRGKLVLDKINEFSMCDIVITDRLHGMIFSIIGKTKCIAFDNSNKKISGVYSTIENKVNSVIISSEKSFEDDFNSLVSLNEIENNLSKDMYKELINEIM